MGFFSWKTQDTDRSICNQFSDRKPFPVIMTDNKGNQWHEDNYEGYGIFGGKDYYELLDEMNGGTGDRKAGIDREFTPRKFPNPTIYPSLSECGKYYNGEQPESCEDQGYFYDDDDDDESEDEDELEDPPFGDILWDKNDTDPAGGHGPSSHI